MSVQVMRSIALSLTVFLGLSLLPAGCSESASENQATEEMLSELSEIRQKRHKELQDQLDSDGGYSINTDRIDDVVDTFESASEDLPPEIRQKLKRQAALLKRAKAVFVPYEEAYNGFVGLGGLDPVTITDAESVEERIRLLGVLIQENERIDKAVPELLRQMDGDLNETNEHIKLIHAVRQTDRVMLPSMRDALQILLTHLGDFEVNEDGMLMFAESVPQEDIDQYNEHIDIVIAASEEQARLQQQNLESKQP